MERKPQRRSAEVKVHVLLAKKFDILGHRWTWMCGRRTWAWQIVIA